MRKFMVSALQCIVLTRRSEMREIFELCNKYLREKRCVQILVGGEYIMERSM